MPYVNIKVTREGVTRSHKEKLIRGAAQFLYEVLDKDPQPTNVVINEVDTDNWGVCDETVTQLRLVSRRN